VHLVGKNVLDGQYLSDTTSADDKRQLEERINHAATNRLDWQWFLADLHRVSGGAKVHMSILDTAANIPLSMMQFGIDPEFAESHREHFGRLSVWGHRTNKTPLGRFHSTRDMISDDDLKKTEFYQGWVRPQENSLGGAATNLAQDGYRRLVMGGMIRDVDREALEHRFIEILKFVAPLIRQAIIVNKLLAGASLEQHIISEAMKPGDAACFVLSPDRQLMFANSVAEALISSGKIVGYDAETKLQFTSDRPNQKLGSALFGLANCDTGFQLPFFAGSGRPDDNFICRVLRLGLNDRLPTPFPLDHFASGYAMLFMTPIE
jgi:hypothetical protein